jgi:hypothetical protein
VENGGKNNYQGNGLSLKCPVTQWHEQLYIASRTTTLKRWFKRYTHILKLKHWNPILVEFDLFFSLSHVPAGEDGMMLRRRRNEQFYMTRPEMLAHALWHKETHVCSLRAQRDKRGGRQRAVRR